MLLGQQLRDKRNELGWTQGVAAQKIGIQQSYLSKLENNQFIPSESVLEQIKQVYGLDLPIRLSVNCENQKDNTSLVIALIVVCFSVALVVIAQAGALYSDTYYTYQAQPIGNVEVQEQGLLSYELTDEYRGEVYQSKFAGQTYTYQLLGERQIARKENIWLTILGSILLTLSCSYLTYRWLSTRHASESR